MEMARYSQGGAVNVNHLLLRVSLDISMADPPRRLQYMKGVWIVYVILCPPRFRSTIGVGVGRQRPCKTCFSLRELDHQGAVFNVLVFLAVTMITILCGVENPNSAQED